MNIPTRIALPVSAAAVAAAVAVPALAGGSPSRGRRAARRSSSHPRTVCVSKTVGRRRLTVCSRTGPAGHKGARGPRGFVGPRGPRGDRGSGGRIGATGAAGPTGVAGPRAAAIVNPEAVGPDASTSGLVNDTGFSAVRRAGTGLYCLTPLPPVEAAGSVAAVSGESGYSSGEVLVPIAVVEARHNDCAANELDVRTYAITSGSSRPVADSGVAFTIVVP